MKTFRISCLIAAEQRHLTIRAERHARVGTDEVFTVGQQHANRENWVARVPAARISHIEEITK